MAATAGRGVDVVLNSLSGELLHASWLCVAKFGRIVEIGKRDFQGHGKLRMSLFEGNRSFFGVDLHAIAAEAPELLGRLLRRTLELVRAGFLEPIPVVERYGAAEVRSAFRRVQTGKQIGKIVVGMEDLMGAEVKKEPGMLRLDGRGAYLLVGGMGGLGKAVSSWLVEYGARELVMFSRSAGKGEGDGRFAEELESQGCRVRMVAGSITSLEDVEAAVKAADGPIKGVINLSMVLQVGFLSVYLLYNTMGP